MGVLLRNLRNIIVKIRASNHRLPIEVGRWNSFHDRKEFGICVVHGDGQNSNWRRV